MDNVPAPPHNLADLSADPPIKVGADYKIDGQDFYDIVLPAGDYVAELVQPRTPGQIARERQTIISKSFSVAAIPAITHSTRIERDRINRIWRNFVEYHVEGNRIPRMTFTDGVYPTTEVTRRSFEVEYNRSGTLNVSFNIDGITSRGDETGIDVIFQPIAITFQVELEPFDNPRLAHRLIRDANGIEQRELRWNIVYHDNKLILDTRGSIGDYLHIEINGNIILGENDNQDFGIWTLDLSQYCDNDMFLIRSLRARAVIVEGPGDYRYNDPDIPIAYNLTSYNHCSPQLRSTDLGLAYHHADQSHIVQELKICKETFDIEEIINPDTGIIEQAGTTYQTGEVLCVRPATPTAPWGQATWARGPLNFNSTIWDVRFPFRRIRPCWVREDGFVETYFHPEDLRRVESIPVPLQQMEELRHAINLNYDNIKRLEELFNQTSNPRWLEEKTAEENLRSNNYTNLRLRAAEYSAIIDSPPEYINASDVESVFNDYLRRTDGNVMVEFPNIWFNSFDDENWVYIQMCHKPMRSDDPFRDHWKATNVRTYPTRPASGIYAENPDGTFTVVHDTIYVGAFYSQKMTRPIDSETYEYFNSNVLSSEYNLEPLEPQDYVSGIRGLDKLNTGTFDVFSFQNLVPLRLLQVFRLCSSDDLQITSTTLEKHVSGHPYDFSRRFAGLDRPFGLGITTEITDDEPIDTVRMPAIFGAYYGNDIQGRTSLWTTHRASTLNWPIPGIRRRDSNLKEVSYWEFDSNIDGAEHSFSQVSEYMSWAAWTKPSEALSATEPLPTAGSSLPMYVTPHKRTTGFASSFGHASSQLPSTSFYTERDLESPLAFTAPLYNLLYRPVWWKPNEDYSLSVTVDISNGGEEVAPNVFRFIVEPGGRATVIVLSNSTGFKQFITSELGGATYVQTRVQRPFTDANVLRASVASGFGARVEPYEIRAILFDTNDEIIKEQLIKIIVSEFTVTTTDSQEEELQELEDEIDWWQQFLTSLP
jgi:hypothetical protein